MSVLDTMPDSKQKRMIRPKNRTVRRFAWLPTIVFNDFACTGGCHEVIWFEHYSCFQQWAIIDAPHCFAPPIWGWVTIKKLKF